MQVADVQVSPSPTAAPNGSKTTWTRSMDPQRTLFRPHLCPLFAWSRPSSGDCGGGAGIGGKGSGGFAEGKGWCIAYCRLTTSQAHMLEFQYLLCRVNPPHISTNAMETSLIWGQRCSTSWPRSHGALSTGTPLGTRHCLYTYAPPLALLGQK